jgi:hypothetical protein
MYALLQQNAVMGFLESLSLVVCAPTSSGNSSERQASVLHNSIEGAFQSEVS